MSGVGKSGLCMLAAQSSQEAMDAVHSLGAERGQEGDVSLSNCIDRAAVKSRRDFASCLNCGKAIRIVYDIQEWIDKEDEMNWLLDDE